MATGKFATAIGCIDGRATGPVTAWLKQAAHANFVDLVTEAGPDKFLLQAEPALLAAAQAKVLVSINAHHSQTLAIAAHYECAGNPVSEAEHKAMVRQCVDLVASWQLGVRVLGLWVNNDWEVEFVCERDGRPA